jgi:hypothetical protein
MKKVLKAGIILPWFLQKAFESMKKEIIVAADDLESRVAIIEDGELAENIRRLMFTFEDIVHVDDRGVQRILKIPDFSVSASSTGIFAAPVSVEAESAAWAFLRVSRPVATAGAPVPEGGTEGGANRLSRLREERTRLPARPAAHGQQCTR